MKMLTIVVTVLGVVVLTITFCYFVTLLPFLWDALSRYIDREINKKFEGFFREDLDLYNQLLERRRERLEGLDKEIHRKQEVKNKIRMIVSERINAGRFYNDLDKRKTGGQ